MVKPKDKTPKTPKTPVDTAALLKPLPPAGEHQLNVVAMLDLIAAQGQVLAKMDAVPKWFADMLSEATCANHVTSANNGKALGYDVPNIDFKGLLGIGIGK